MLFFINNGANCFKEGSDCFDLGGAFLKKEGINRIVLVEFLSSRCWKLQALQPLFHQEAPSHCSLHCNRGTTSPPRPTVVDWNNFKCWWKKMSLHVDLRLTVAVFGAALCPPWTALGVLQVGLVGSIWGCSTASFSRPCTKKTTRNNIEQAQEYNLTKHFGQCWCLKLRPVKVYELLDV